MYIYRRAYIDGTRGTKPWNIITMRLQMCLNVWLLVSGSGKALRRSIFLSPFRALPSCLRVVAFLLCRFSFAQTRRADAAVYIQLS